MSPIAPRQKGRGKDIYEGITGIKQDKSKRKSKKQKQRKDNPCGQEGELRTDR